MEYRSLGDSSRTGSKTKSDDLRNLKAIFSKVSMHNTLEWLDEWTMWYCTLVFDVGCFFYFIFLNRWIVYTRPTAEMYIYAAAGVLLLVVSSGRTFMLNKWLGLQRLDSSRQIYLEPPAFTIYTNLHSSHNQELISTASTPSLTPHFTSWKRETGVYTSKINLPLGCCKPLTLPRDLVRLKTPQHFRMHRYVMTFPAPFFSFFSFLPYHSNSQGRKKKKKTGKLCATAPLVSISLDIFFRKSSNHPRRISSRWFPIKKSDLSKYQINSLVKFGLVINQILLYLY